MAKKVDDRQMSLLDLLIETAEAVEQPKAVARARRFDDDQDCNIPRIVGFDRRWRFNVPGGHVETSFSQGEDGLYYHGFGYWTGHTGFSTPDTDGPHKSPEDALIAAAKEVMSHPA